MSLYDDIRSERARQDRQWGGPRKDDRNTYEEWCSWVIKQLGRAQRAGEDYSVSGPDYDSILLLEMRYSLVKAAALIVAQIEALDRRVATTQGK